MATESPIRMMEARGKWSSHPGTTSYTSSPINMPVDEEGLLVKGRNQNGKAIVPNRSGSAPPSVEGSRAALENLHLFSSGTNFSSNPHVLHHVGSGGISSLSISRGTLPTHKEESDDEKSPQNASNVWMDRGPSGCNNQELSFSASRPRAADMRQVNKPQTSMPLSDQLHGSCHGSVGEAVNPDTGYSSLPDRPNVVPNMAAPTFNADGNVSSKETDVSLASASRSVSHVSLDGALSPAQRDAESSISLHRENEAVVDGASDVRSLRAGFKNLQISPPSNIEVHQNPEERALFYQNNFLKHQMVQQNSNLQFQGSMPQYFSHGVNNAYFDVNQIPNVGKVPSSEVQPVLQSSGFTPPHYPSTAAYMPPASPYYSGLPPPGVIYSSQYGAGGYAINPAYYSPFLSGYSPQHSMPFTYDGASAPQYNTRTSGVPSPSASSHSVDIQSLNKYYGQFGIMQNSYSDSHMQYRPPYGDFYNVPGQLDPMGIRDTVIAGQGNVLTSQKRSDFSGLSSDPRSQNQIVAGINQRRGGFTSPNCYGNPTNVGVYMPIPNPTIPSPVLPGSPIGGSNVPYGRSQARFPTDSSGNAGVYASWPGQRGFESANYSKTYSFLEELKSGKGRRFELSEILGHVEEFSVDQHGSRFIQQKLENCNPDEKASVFREVLPHASKLMTDVFGNYVIQKFFEYGTSEQRRELANHLRGQILPLSLQMYGCRVIQKALDVIELEQKADLVRELDGHVLKCVRDQNGNHVIQKCIESIPTEKIDFIISAFHGQVATLSMHPYGCRVIQRVLEHCGDGTQSQFIVDEILESVCDLAQNQYGNYVTQHVLERGKAQERSQIIKKLSGQVVPLCQHKFASNVIERCLQYGDYDSMDLLITEILRQNEGNDSLLVMMKDQYANYVVQKILDLCSESQRDLLLDRIKVHLPALKKYTYGKHIVARVERLCGEETPASTGS